MLLNDASYQLILNGEVGGGENYYNRFCLHPVWPGASSGVTIGVGYDLGQNSADAFQNDWGEQLDAGVMSRLAQTVGAQGQAAQALLASVKDVSVAWAAAQTVYQNVTIPKVFAMTQALFPGFDDLAGNAKGALVSLVFNRGTKMVGPSRTEMVIIRSLVPQKDYEGMANAIESMKRLWPDSAGLRNRRDAEAAFMRTAETEA